MRSDALAGRLDAMGCDPAEELVKLGRRAAEAGDVDLAIKAYGALMPFRWPKLKESTIDLGLGLSGSIADRLEAAQARLSITVVSGIDRPPDDPEPDRGPPPPASPPPSPPPKQASPSPTASPKPRSTSADISRSSSPSPAPPDPPQASPPTAGGAFKAHDYWTQRREPEVKPLTEYDPWEQTT
jgi:hypothetical protein